MSILLLYLRIFSVQTFTRYFVFFVMFYLTVVFSLVTAANSWWRAPRPGTSWQPENFRDGTMLADISVAYGYVILIMDVLIFIIPLRAVWILHGTWKWKSRVFGVFAAGVL